MHYLKFFVGLVLLASCTVEPELQQNASVKPKATAASLQATGPTVTIVTDDQAPVDWVVSPEADIDVFSLVCDPEDPTTVIYRSDSDELRFHVQGLQRTTFHIMSVDGIAATNELRCLPAPARYEGSYDAARPGVEVYSDDLDPLVETYFDQNGPGVLVGVWRDGRDIYSRAIGFSNVEKGQDRLITDQFEIASLSKEFTAIAVMQLVERGLIDLDAPISTFYPELPWGRSVTVRHLLAHTSGLGNRTYNDTYTRMSVFDPQQALAQLSSSTPAFDPGSSYQYSNAGMTLLALITEKVTGISRAEHISKNILEPANMTETRFLWELTTEEIERYTAGYNESGEIITRLPLGIHPTTSFGSGDLVSTLTDLRRWHVALRENKLISRATFASMIEPVTFPDGSISERGLAFMVGSVAGQKLIYNSGDISTHTRHGFLADQDVSVIVNANVDIDGNFDVSGRVRDQIIAKLMNSYAMNLYGTTIDVRGDY